MTVMVPMIRISLMLSVIMASALWRKHKEAVEPVNTNVTTLQNKTNQRLGHLGICPSCFYGDGMQGCTRAKKTFFLIHSVRGEASQDG